MALLLALLFIVLLAAIVMEYAYENRVEATFVENGSTEFEAEVAAKSAVAAGLSLLAADIQIQQMYPDLSGLAGFTGGTSGSDGDDFGSGGGRVTSYMDAWALGVPYRPINKAVMQCVISDEYGKLNLNALLQDPMGAYSVDADGNMMGQELGMPAMRDERGGLPGTESDDGLMLVENDLLVETLRMLFELRGADEEAVDAILDWIDPDEDSRPDGAESEYYQRLEIPFSAKNAPLDSVEELLLIKGMTPELFFGDPDKGQVPLTELLTVSGSPRGQINPNTAGVELLQALGEALGQPQLAEVIVEEREYTPLSSDDQIQQLGVILEEPARPATRDESENLPDERSLYGAPFVYASDVFRIRGNGQSGEAAVQIEAYVYRNPNAVTYDTYDSDGSLRSNSRLREGPRNNPREGSLADRDRNRNRNSRYEQDAPSMFRILDWRVLK